MKKYLNLIIVTVITFSVVYGVFFHKKPVTQEFVAGSLPVLSIPQGGTNSSTTPARGSLIYYNGTGEVATGTQLTVGNILATSSTATNQIGGVLFSGASPVAGLGTSNYQAVISQNINNIAGQLYLANTNMGANAVTSLTFGNGNSTNVGASSAYIGGIVFCGPNFSTAGFGGCPPNGLAMYNTDGGLALGAISSNAASSSVTFYAGNNSSFAGGNPDMILTGGNAFLGLATTTPYSKLSVVGQVVAANYVATSTATSTIASGGLQIGPSVLDSSGYDNLLTLVPKRTFGNSSNSQYKEGVLDIDGTLSNRTLLNIIQQSTAGTGCSPQCVNIQQQSTSATGILMQFTTAAIGAAGNLIISGKGQNCPAFEQNEVPWNNTAGNQGGMGKWQTCSHTGDWLLDSRNNPDNAYVPTISVTSPFSSTTPQRVTLFPGNYALASGNWTDGTGTLNVNGTSTNATILNLNTGFGATEGNILQVKENGHLILGGAGNHPTCDANCTYIAGNDNAFRVQLGSSITSSTVTFSTTFGTLAPICVANEGSAGNVDVSASSTPTTVVLTTLSALTNKDVEVLCTGIQ